MQKPSGRSLAILCCIVLLSLLAYKIHHGSLRAIRTAFNEPGIDYIGTRHAGEMWLHGKNPYQGWKGDGVIHWVYPYLPTAAPVALWVALPTEKQGAQIVWALNLLADAVVTLFLIQVLRRELDPVRERSTLIVLSLAVVVILSVSQGVTYNFQASQTSLFALAAICVAWEFSLRNRPATSGFWAAVASFKPTISGLVFLCLLRRNVRRFLPAVLISALVLAAVPLWQIGPIRLATDWLRIVSMYSSFEGNRPDFPWAFGVGSVLYRMHLPTSRALILGLLCMGWAIFRFKDLKPNEQFALAVAWPVLFLLGHYYDMVALFPLYLSVILAVRKQPMLAVVATFLMFAANDETGIVQRRIPRLLVYPVTQVAIACAFWAVLIVIVEYRRRKARAVAHVEASDAPGLAHQSAAPGFGGIAPSPPGRGLG
jgi:hypothetical protein